MIRMSFFLTTAQVLAKTKTVTRRLKCRLKVGERFLAVERLQGLKKGETQRVLATCEVTGLWREPLSHILVRDNEERGNDECMHEGFPKLSGEEFVAMFCKHMKCERAGWVYRIEFKYV